MDIDDLRRRLDHLRAVDPHLQLFGAGEHRHQLGTPLSEAELADLERRHRVSLPPAFRTFLGELGDGGAGPGYGIPSVRTDDPWHFEPVGAEGSPGRRSDPGQPYPFTERWSMPEEPGTAVAVPGDAHPFDGCLRLSDLGCGYTHFLVLTGPAAGEVWADDSEGGGPVARRSRDFASYYSEWLDISIVECAAGAAQEQLHLPGQDQNLLDAIPIAERLVRDDRVNVTRHNALGTLLLYADRFDDAEAVLRRSLELEGGLISASILLATALRLRDRYADAAEVVDRALATRPRYMVHCRELLWEKARSLVEIGRSAEAVDAADDARRNYGYFLMRSQIDFFILAVRAGQRERAEAAVEEYIERRTDATLDARRREVYEVVVQATAAWGMADVAAEYQRRLDAS